MSKETFSIYKERGIIKGAALRAHLDSLPDGDYFITVDTAAKKKSNAQNSYLHVLFTIAAKEMNREGFGSGMQWTKERVKAYVKRAELYPMEDVMMPGGEVVQVWKDTHELSKDEAMETISRVIAHFADEFGIVLPEPLEQIRLVA